MCRIGWANFYAAHDDWSVFAAAVLIRAMVLVSGLTDQGRTG
jgi:hypothetical protein